MGLLSGALTSAVVFGASLGVIIAVIVIPDDEERALCDKAVHTVLHSNDLTEITRAGIIIHRLDCGFRRRLKNENPIN